MLNEIALENLLEKKDADSYIEIIKDISEKSAELPKVKFKLKLSKERYRVNTANMEYFSVEGLRNVLMLYYLTSNENGGSKEEIYNFISSKLSEHNIDYNEKKIKSWIDTQFADGKNHLRTDERRTKVKLIGQVIYESDL
ncbi:MAG: hypothetical protein PHN56_05710 [Candidatus Nanoarchaeia archaeon]|nr:hypothetical protein [Candidatus Nanoarchaeia archaeon]